MKHTHNPNHAVTLYRTESGRVNLCTCCKDLELAFKSIRMGFSRESLCDLQCYVSGIDLSQGAQEPGLARYCIYFRNFPLVLTYHYEEILELRQLLEESLFALELHEFLHLSGIESNPAQNG